MMSSAGRVSLRSRLFACCLLAALLPVAVHAATPARFDARITWTAFGIPHVEAGTYAGLGYGAGYALAEANPCLLLDTVLTVRGDRSRVFGAAGTAMPGLMPGRNLDSDLFFRSAFDRDELRRAYDTGAPDASALLRGAAAGINRFLSDTGAFHLPAACRDIASVGPVTTTDLQLMAAQKAVEASSGAFTKAIAEARPPSNASGNASGDAPADPAPASAPPPAIRAGSNGYAFGRDVTRDGSGLLVANPHFPWSGANRFFELHLTIPGQLDAMGATLLFLPVVVIGFNRDVAWTHTVSTGARFTLFQLQLVPNHPLQYRVDGRIETMRARTVSVPVLQPDGRTIRTVTRTLYSTRFGPVVSEPALGLRWTGDTAFAFADAEIADTRLVEQWLALDRAGDVSGIRDALRLVHGAPWVNTIAADRHGKTLYADLSRVPDTDDARLDRCKGSAFAQNFTRHAGLPMLDGSLSGCDWTRGPDGGALTVDRMPSALRTDYVLNSNDSFWLSVPRQPITGVPAVVGRTGVQQNPRTRAGNAAIETLLADTRNRIDSTALETMLLDDRDFIGALVSEDLARLCRQPQSGPGDVAEGCRVLAGWDKSDRAASRGAAFFREFWTRAQSIPSLWQVPFDPADPLHTPRTLAIDTPAVAGDLRDALAATVQQFRALGLAPDVALGDVQRLRNTDTTIALPGGRDNEGVLNVLGTGPLGRDGYDTSELAGSSFMQVVGWSAGEPVANALLTYGQQADPDAPHARDQTVRYAAGRWIRLPFTASAIAADPRKRTLHLVAP